ncbi:MAG: hypothetical protein IPO21_06730 [Bacteroidales bacterium]|nr:hypothetical protein [Bacteroidales bacterium]
MHKSIRKGDTVFVYEEIVVYDTVFVYETVKETTIDEVYTLTKAKSLNILQLDTINNTANLLIISDGKTATISLENIILKRNIKNIESMKKLTFFGVVLFALKSMVFAQTEFEISLGGGIWYESTNIEYIDKPTSPLAGIGIYGSRSLLKGNIKIKTGVNYNFLLSTGDYKFDGTTGVGHSSQGIEYGYINENFGHNFLCISIPVYLYFSKYKLKPFIGCNYNHLQSQSWTAWSGKNVMISNNFLD